MASWTPRCAGALKESAAMDSNPAGSTRRGNCNAACSSCRSAATTGSRRSGRASSKARSSPCPSPRSFPCSSPCSSPCSLPAAEPVPVLVPVPDQLPDAGRAPRAAIRVARATSSPTCSTSTPSQPATVRVYSGRKERSRMPATMGATAPSARTRPSALVRSNPREGGAHRELEHRHGVLDEGKDRCLSGGLAQLAGILAGLLHGHEALRCPALVLPERTHCGLLAGGVSVKGEDHLSRCQIGLVTHDAAQHLDVLDAERGAAGGHRGLDAGKLTGHHVRVALDHDRLAIPGDCLLGEVKAIEHERLLVDRRLAGVEVLGLDPVIIEQTPCAKTHHIAGDIADGPHQATTESVIEAAPASGQPAPDDLVVGETLGPQVSGELLAPAW